MKNNKGITLIALVITIIVLLILAGVSISLVVGNNGILTQSKSAVETNREAKAKEEVEMAWSSARADYWSDWVKNSSTVTSEAFYQTKLNEYLEETKAEDQDVVVTGNGDNTYTVTYKTKDQGIAYTFLVSEDGKVEKLNIDSNNKNTFTFSIGENVNDVDEQYRNSFTYYSC